MAINLKKGQAISLEKDNNDLSQITVGLGWKIRKRGLFSKLAGGNKEHDLDVIAFLMDKEGVVRNIGEKLVGSDVVFFNNLKHPSGDVFHTGDERVGGTGDTDNEKIIVRLHTLPARYHRILFLAQIYHGVVNKQHFGEVESAYMRAVDAKGVEIARYRLDSDSAYNNKCIMEFGEVYRHEGGWKFRALGNAHNTDNFVEILRTHM